MNQAKRVANVDVHFHADVPLITFLGLVHFRVALATFVLGGTRYRNDGGVHNAARAVTIQLISAMIIKIASHRYP